MNINTINAVQKLLLSCGVFFFGLGVFIYAIQPAKAADAHIFNNAQGRIMMDQSSFVYNNQYYYNILVWDTETGKSKLYYTNSREWVLDTQLPASPLY